MKSPSAVAPLSRPGSRFTIPHLRWTVCALLFAASTINYIDRQTVSVLKPHLESVLKMSESDYVRWLNDEINNIKKTSAVVTKRVCPKCKTVKMVSALFGKSSIVIDWCPQCHGMWLDQDEFGSVTEYLKHELYSMHSKEMEKKALDEVKLLWSGGPESRYEELLDVRATISALINATIFEHPTLARLCMGAPRL